MESSSEYKIKHKVMYIGSLGENKQQNINIIYYTDKEELGLASLSIHTHKIIWETFYPIGSENSQTYHKYKGSGIGTIAHLIAIEELVKYKENLNKQVMHRINDSMYNVSDSRIKHLKALGIALPEDNGIQLWQYATKNYQAIKRNEKNNTKKLRKPILFPRLYQ